MRSKTPRKAAICVCGDHAWVPTTKGYVALVDVQDMYLFENTNYFAKKIDNTVYAFASIKRSFVFLHKQILPAKNGLVIDHVCGNGLDNRRRLLRYASLAQNRLNSRVKIKGFTWHKRSMKYQVIIKIRKKNHYVGLFSSEQEAQSAYIAAYRRLRSECEEYISLAQIGNSEA